MSLVPQRLLNRARAAPRVAWKLAQHGRPNRLVLFGSLSLGDDLLCTVLFREWRRRGERGLWMMSRHPQLFAGNPDVDRVLPVDDYHANALQQLGAKVVRPYYAKPSDDNQPRDIFMPHHILAEMCRLGDIHGEIALRPYLHLSAAEIKRGRLHPRQIAIQSTCRSAAVPFTTKEWGPERLAGVAGRLSGDFQLVQIGAATDPALPVATDYRGRTSLREAAAILAASDAFIGLEGFLAHMARAVDCPSVVVMGGRARPATVGYACNRNFFGAVDCAPCGLRDGCPFDLKCMHLITPEAVADAAAMLAHSGIPRPLPADTWNLP